MNLFYDKNIPMVATARMRQAIISDGVRIYLMAPSLAYNFKSLCFIRKGGNADASNNDVETMLILCGHDH